MTRLLSVMVLSLTIVAGTSATAHATEVGNGRNFGLGFQLGDPTALIGKAFIGRGNAIDFGLGFGVGWGYARCRDSHGDWYYCGDRYGRNWSLHGDYLWQDNLVRGRAQLDWHIGAGARIDFWDAFDGGRVAVTARMPIGLDLSFDRPNFLEVFFELDPGIVIVPPLIFDLDAAIGVRFFF
jgi:hypothetical protein